jgi:hypothetical protein
MSPEAGHPCPRRSGFRALRQFGTMRGRTAAPTLLPLESFVEKLSDENLESSDFNFIFIKNGQAD